MAHKPVSSRGRAGRKPRGVATPPGLWLAHPLPHFLHVRALRGLRLVGADLAEVSAPYDSAELTSLLAANLLFEIHCLLA